MQQLDVGDPAPTREIAGAGAIVPERDDRKSGGLGAEAEKQWLAKYATAPVQESSAATTSTADQISAVLRDQFGILPKKKVIGYSKPYPNEFDLIPLPPKYRLPDFNKFSGSEGSSSIEHVSRYLAQLGMVSASDELRVRFFSQSLTGLAFGWYTSLQPNSVRSWKQLEEQVSHPISFEATAGFVIRHGKDKAESSHSRKDKEEAVPCDRPQDDDRRYLTEEEVRSIRYQRPLSVHLLNKYEQKYDRRRRYDEDDENIVGLMQTEVSSHDRNNDGDDLIKTNITLSDFNGQASEAKGVLNVELTVGRKTIPTAFFIVDSKSNYAGSYLGAIVALIIAALRSVLRRALAICGGRRQTLVVLILRRIIAFAVGREVPGPRAVALAGGSSEELSSSSSSFTSSEEVWHASSNRQDVEDLRDDARCQGPLSGLGSLPALRVA
ncbi:hypothetical protein QYE76_029315 [Lolium multiflorum]|uniref:Retrotransposon gag domain-containing protein n=1 Tax=Lolium multiflorum TaxID=4521 RepID=A0AAD8VFD4_LOLMU|nr:hypothetical protein QYE76_029315 [Lolium multiflorum]